ncbi:acyl-CoA N-acyltransferase [Artomyces pyxidatus]|uniref:Acyl-CoA N-acyltransferase n=1 Tax=Artomyces pyxidatus TaxID=48021 RepID=A0ACB8TK43_9AGAM|nr:acyl-CoA N-acyltransferase [Artomyces pyxidatus]
MTLSIRRATPADAPALSQICLLTGDAGKSAAPIHTHSELPGLVWALPFVLIPKHTWGFVLVDDDDTVKGYILGTSDTNAFRVAEEETWWPPLRERFPLEAKEGRTEADQWYIELIHRAPDPAPAECLAFGPAHMHIDLLPEVQRQGWGRKLVDAAVQHLKGLGIGALWLGMDPRNTEARKFYLKLGYKEIEGPRACVGLKFEDWKGL